jgi:peptide/nickel transport system substrate-binding protein
MARAAIAITLTLTACTARAATSQAPQTDVNPHDPADLRNGGELRLAADQLPDNWNYFELDGPTGEGYRMLSTVMPTLWAQNADGTVRSNGDYVESARLVSHDPQVIVFRLNPKARWSSGAPLSWEDFKAQADALSGSHKDYKLASTTGYEDIARVERGASDQEVRITFKRRFAEWQTIFSPLYPSSLYADAQEFNTGWLNAPLVTAGPFKIGSIDPVAQTVTVVRDPNWWGPRPRLDAITFRVIPKTALAESMAAGTIDSYAIGSNADLFAKSAHVPGTTIRQAPATDYSTLAFNGTPGAILDDPALRVAVEKGIDTKAIATAALGRIEPHAKPLGNHLFLQSAKEYRDNSAVAGFDPAAARRQLDSLGWKLNGHVREKDGKALAIRFVIGAGNALSQQISGLVASQLEGIGAHVDIQTVPAADYFRSYVNVGNFDISTFRWLVTAFPLTNSRGVYYLDPNNVNENYGKVGTSTINGLFDEATAELDGAKRAALANRIDQEIWKSGSQLPLFQSSGAVAVRATVANYGAAGYASIPFDWVQIGFTT